MCNTMRLSWQLAPISRVMRQFGIVCDSLRLSVTACDCLWLRSIICNSVRRNHRVMRHSAIVCDCLLQPAIVCDSVRYDAIAAILYDCLRLCNIVKSSTPRKQPKTVSSHLNVLKKNSNSSETHFQQRLVTGYNPLTYGEKSHFSSEDIVADWLLKDVAS